MTSRLKTAGRPANAHPGGRRPCRDVDCHDRAPRRSICLRLRSCKAPTFEKTQRGSLPELCRPLLGERRGSPSLASTVDTDTRWQAVDVLMSIVRAEAVRKARARRIAGPARSAFRSDAHRRHQSPRSDWADGVSEPCIENRHAEICASIRKKGEEHARPSHRRHPRHAHRGADGAGLSGQGLLSGVRGRDLRGRAALAGAELLPAGKRAGDRLDPFLAGAYRQVHGADRLLQRQSQVAAGHAALRHARHQISRSAARGGRRSRRRSTS